MSKYLNNIINLVEKIPERVPKVRRLKKKNLILFGTRSKMTKKKEIRKVNI